MKKRSLVMFAAVLFAFSGIMAKVYQLTAGTLSETAEQQAGYTVTVANSRGTIYDRQMRPLTNTGTEYRACIVPTPEVLAVLSENLDAELWSSLSEKLQTGKPVVAILPGYIPLVKGITLYSVPVRTGEQSLAPHLMGYMDSDGLHGVTGAELVFDERLNEMSGSLKITYQVDGSGKPLQGVEPKVENTLDRSRGGVALTIDQDIQKAVEAVAKEKMTRGAAIVMEPSTGRILAMVSMPDYDPEHVADYLEAADSPLLNRAICNYNCGSVFKIVAAATALEQGIPTSQPFTCTGSIPVGSLTIKCHRLLGHGTLDMVGGFADSCNPYFIQLMQMVGAEPFYDKAVALGFDRPILLAEGFKTARAALPSEAELQSPAALANLSIGQGSLLATPVHIAQLAATVVNGGLVVRPTVLQGYVDENGNLTEEEADPPVRAFSEEIADQLMEMMRQVLQTGTGKAANPLNGSAGGKTGTAETGWKQEDDETMVQSWITGFYPSQDPKYVITVLSEGYSETKDHSSPIFKAICDELYLLDKVEESATTGNQ